MDNRKINIGIIDHDAGNLFSIHNAFTKLRFKSCIINKTSDIDLLNITHLILPGVGSFESAMHSLNEKNWIPVLLSWIKSGKSFLGICLGMQLLLEESEESPQCKGFGVIKGKNRRIKAKKVPHIGWNEVIKTKNSKLKFTDQTNSNSFYFVHSYYAECDKNYVTHICHYSQDFPAIINVFNSYGFQFHPEKSGDTGLLLLKQWVEI